jgi:hypothetical protein
MCVACAWVGAENSALYSGRRNVVIPQRPNGPGRGAVFQRNAPGMAGRKVWQEEERR